MAHNYEHSDLLQSVRIILKYFFKLLRLLRCGIDLLMSSSVQSFTILQLTCGLLDASLLVGFAHIREI